MLKIVKCFVKRTIEESQENKTAVKVGLIRNQSQNKGLTQKCSRTKKRSADFGVTPDHSNTLEFGPYGVMLSRGGVLYIIDKKMPEGLDYDKIRGSGLGQTSQGSEEEADYFASSK